MTTITFDVVGTPAPQGSKTSVLIAGKARMIEGASDEMRRRHKTWRAAVTDTARELAATLPAPLDGPLELTVTFRFPMPASRPKRSQTPGTELPKTSKPDLDKLVRSTGDALTESGLIRDDARFWRTTATKVEVIGWTGATITITTTEETQ